MKPVTEDQANEAIVNDELRLHGSVNAALSELGARVPGAPDFDNALLSLRDQLAEAKPEDIGPLVEQMMRISNIAQRYGMGRDLPVNPASPYFAHLRLEEREQIRDVLIGKRGFVDRHKGVQIVDWRHAPVSRIYYRYEEGDDYEEPVGEHTLEGVIQARRTLTIDEGQLRRIGCPQGTFVTNEQGQWFALEPLAVPRLAGGQGTAMRAPAERVRQRGQLGAHPNEPLRPDKHLPEIAALIDPAQFELIIRPESGLVVLQGGAGSGKTTVALHRVAYLNFAHGERFRADRMLVIVLSEAMARYVERVLPSLGVRGVVVRTAQDWFQRTLRSVVPSAFARYNNDTPAVVLRFKKHALLLELLPQFVARQVTKLEEELEAALASTPDGALVLAKWQASANQPPVRRCTSLKAWLKRPDQPLTSLTLQQAQTATRRVLARLKDVMADWAEIFTDRPLLTEAVQRYCPGEFTARELEQVCRWCTQQIDEQPDFADGESSREHDRERGRERDRERDEEGQLPPYISLDGQDERELPVAGRLDYVDTALLLFLSQLKYGALQAPSGRQLQYEHLVVDEAQDLSAIELKVLLSATSELQSATLAGDVAQRLVFDNGFTTWEDLLARLGLTASSNTTLRLGYRSTEQIMALARHLALSDQEWQPLRAGALVELHRFAHQGEAVALLADALRSLVAREPRASVACIARYPEQAHSYAEALSRAEVPGVRLVANQEFSFKAGIEVTDVAQVKGLEFDYVILLDVSAASYPETLESRHMLYVGATRAAHQLWLISLGSPSLLLPANLLQS